MTSDDPMRRHWHRNLRLTGLLLLVWLAVTFGIAYWARELSFTFFGWPFSFWVAAQGAPIVYVAVIALYAQRMHRLDRSHGVAEED